MDDNNTTQIRNYDQNTVNRLSLKVENNLEDYRVFWVDEQIKRSEDCRKTLKALEAITKSIDIFDDIEKSLSDIEELKDNSTIFFIVSGTFAQNHVHRFSSSRIGWIYIFCYDKGFHKALLSETQSKIRGAFNDSTELIKTLSTDIKTYCDRWSFDERSVWFQCQESYAYYHLVNSILANLQYTEEARREFIDECRAYYRKDPSMLKKIEKFEENYTSDKVLQYYTQDSCFHTIVNQALRTRQIDIIFKCRMFIADLSAILYKRYIKYVNESLTNRKKIISTVYRGQYLSENELKILASLPKYFFINTFASTSRDRRVALTFISEGKSPPPNKIPVLFEVKLEDQLIANYWPYADISDLNINSHEEEVLIGFGIQLKVCSVTGIDDGSPYVTVKFSSLAHSPPALLLKYDMRIVWKCIKNEPAENHTALIDLLKKKSNGSLLEGIPLDTLWQCFTQSDKTVLLCMYEYFGIFGDEDSHKKAIEEYKKMFIINQIKTKSYVDQLSFIANQMTSGCIQKVIAIYEKVFKPFYDQQHFSNCSLDDVANVFHRAGFAYKRYGGCISGFENRIPFLKIALECYEKAHEYKRKINKCMYEKEEAIQKLMITKAISSTSSNMFESELMNTMMKTSEFNYKDTENNTLASIWFLTDCLKDTKREQFAHFEILSNYLDERTRTLPFFTTSVLSPLLVKQLSPTLHDNQFNELKQIDQNSNNLTSNILLKYKQYMSEWYMLHKLNILIKNFEKQISNVGNIALLSNKLIQQLNMAIILCMIISPQTIMKNIAYVIESNEKFIFFSDYDFEIYGHFTFDAIEYCLKQLSDF